MATRAGGKAWGRRPQTPERTATARGVRLQSSPCRQPLRRGGSVGRTLSPDDPFGASRAAPPDACPHLCRPLLMRSTTPPPDPQHTDPADLIEAYFEKGWTDGLPVVPPSEKAVAAMLAAVDLPAGAVVGTIPGRNVRVTADRVAVNAVMAGCRPEYFPVVVAALRGLTHPVFAYHGPASSTGGSAMVVMVHGPLAETLGINAGNNAFGQGWRPNATIGRAVRLTMMNAMNTKPGLLDRATLGTPGKYSFCFAENPAYRPWDPF